MPPYSSEDFDRIAAAIGKQVADVSAHQKHFENAACAFRLERGLPSPELARARGTTPYKLRLKIQRISKSARRLLRDLGVRNTKDAYDGPGDLEILTVLSWAAKQDEGLVTTATRRVGRLAEIIEAIELAKALERWADQTADEVIEFGRLTVPKEHQGDVAVNDWIAAIMSVYMQITGKDPGHLCRSSA